jgi:hypothetical protein
VLSTRDFRDPDLGVMLWFKKVETGVERSSLIGPAGVLFSERAARRDKGVEAPAGAGPATLGVRGALLGGFVEALRVGMSGLCPCCFSYGGMLTFPLFTVRGVGTRIIAF